MRNAMKKLKILTALFLIIILLVPAMADIKDVQSEIKKKIDDLDEKIRALESAPAAPTPPSPTPTPPPTPQPTTCPAEKKCTANQFCPANAWADAAKTCCSANCENKIQCSSYQGGTWECRASTCGASETDWLGGYRTTDCGARYCVKKSCTVAPPIPVDKCPDPKAFRKQKITSPTLIGQTATIKKNCEEFKKECVGKPNYESEKNKAQEVCTSAGAPL